MFWRAYFWTYVALAILSALAAALRPSELGLTDWIDLAVFMPVGLFAVWSQAFDKWFVHPTAWRFVLSGRMAAFPGKGSPAAALERSTPRRAWPPLVERYRHAPPAWALLLTIPPLVAFYSRRGLSGRRPAERCPARPTQGGRRRPRRLGHPVAEHL